ncbi:uncharacterized protein LOC143364080 [Halictus rubicundus]|uniref:uncharacterized protein LOC143364080 n=1 Tax=Halictus rubicundus TaxID=77578 RepID=UPI0040372F0D
MYDRHMTVPNTMLNLWLIFMLIQSSRAIIGYDCNGHHLNVTTLSLKTVGDCNIDQVVTKTEEVYIQLLQLSDYSYADIIQCKVVIDRTVSYCGMHSHISAVQNGISEYLESITEEQCRRMHLYGTMYIGRNIYLSNLKDNGTVTRPFMLAGKLNVDGRFQGAQFSDPYGSWDNVIVQAVAKITLRTASVPVQLEANKIMLKSGTVCTFQSGTCLDDDDGYTYWKTYPKTTFKFEQFDVLYEGLASRLTDSINQEEFPAVFALTKGDITFALTKMGETPICGYTLFQTEHPKLFILETIKGRTFIGERKMRVENLDIFTYINSKFVYIEKHIKSQVNNLYKNMLTQKCNLEKQVLTNALTLATIKPDEFARIITKEAGHMALVAGEVIHIIKCVAVEVKIRHTETCFTELPVKHGNKSQFLTPMTHIITNQGTHRDCNQILPVMYEIDQTWHRITPKPIEAVPPQILQPLKEPIWRYVNPSNLATSGIYTQGDLNDLRDHIMFPAEKSAILNSVAQSITGKTLPDGSISIMDMINEETLNKIAENTAEKLWHGFITFGSFSAGMLAVFIIFKFSCTRYTDAVSPCAEQHGIR